MKKQRKEVQLNKEIRKSLVMILVITMIMSLCACTDGSASTTQQQQKPVEVTVAEPTKAAEPTPEPTNAEEPTPEPTEEVEPTPEPVEESPYMIKGLDFTSFNGNQTGFWADLDNNTYEGLAWAVRTKFPDEDNKITDVLFNEDSYVVPSGLKTLGFLLYTPKNVNSESDITVLQGNVFVESYGNVDNDGNTYNKNMYVMKFSENNPTLNNEPLAIEVTFEDGTSETIRIYVTKE